MLAKATTTVTHERARSGRRRRRPGHGHRRQAARRTGVTGKVETTLAEIFVGGVGFLAGAGGRGEATDSGAVRALVGDGLDVDAERRDDGHRHVDDD